MIRSDPLHEAFPHGRFRMTPHNMDRCILAGET